jgi:hypothetical protein
MDNTIIKIDLSKLDAEIEELKIQLNKKVTLREYAVQFGEKVTKSDTSTILGNAHTPSLSQITPAHSTNGKLSVTDFVKDFLSRQDGTLSDITEKYIEYSNRPIKLARNSISVALVRLQKDNIVTKVGTTPNSSAIYRIQKRAEIYQPDLISSVMYKE